MQPVEIKGTFIKVAKTEEYDYANEHWYKSGFAIMREGEYSKQVAFFMHTHEPLTILDSLKPGMPMLVSFTAKSHENPQKPDSWFTELRCSKFIAYNPLTQEVEVSYPVQTAMPAEPENAMPTEQIPEWNKMPSEDENDKLPF